MAIKPPAPVLDSPRDVQIPKTAREQPTVVDKTVNKARVDFKPKEFERAIKQKGYYLIWRKSMLCPCKSLETGQSQLGCSFCNQSGYVYVDPIEVQGIMTGLGYKKSSYTQMGNLLDGIAQMSVQPEFRPGFMDSYQMKDSVMVFNEWLEKGLRRGFRQGLPARHDATRYRVVNVIRMITFSGTNLVELKEKQHFNVTKDGLIEWTPQGDSSIADGTVVSVHYEYRPVWVVVNHPNSIRDTLLRGDTKGGPIVAGLPVMSLVQLDYMYTAQRSGETDVRDFPLPTGTIGDVAC